MSINITKHTSTNNTSYTLGRTIKYIVIHYTAGTTSRTGTAWNTANMFGQYGLNASADFIVDDTTIVQFSPDIRNYYCWHCGDIKNWNKGGSYYGICTNSNSIGIEVCSTNDTGRITQANDSHFSFTNAVIDRAVELTKYLMKTYNIPASNVIRHYDVTGKYCPGIRGWNEDSGDASKWKNFKTRIKDVSPTVEEKKTENVSHKNEKPLYRVRKTWADSKSQIGAFTNLNSAKALADKKKGYAVFDNGGKLIYPIATIKTGVKPYLVKITADILNVRRSAGMSTSPITTVKKDEVYTIVEEKNGWGLLKAYKTGRNGWISLRYTKRV